MVKKCLIGLGVLILGMVLPKNAHTQAYTKADTLRGMLSPLRTCYDVTFYDLEVKIDGEKRRIAGRNIIYFRATQAFKRLQIDLFANLVRHQRTH